MIYDWDMKIEKVEGSAKEYYTPNLLYEVRNGKVIVDKDYKNADKKFTLEEFLSKWQGNWTITRVKINNTWYKLEDKESDEKMDREKLIRENVMLICFIEGIDINENDRIVRLTKDLKENYTMAELKKCYEINCHVRELRINRMLSY